MPISAVDAITPAVQHTKKQLIEPFRFSQWAKLALVGLMAGELHSSGCNFRGLPMPPIQQGGQGSQQFLELGHAAALPALDPKLYAFLIGLLIILGTILFFTYFYVSSVARFMLFDSVIARYCEIGRTWNARQKPGIRFFGFQLLLLLATLMGFTILIGIPAGIAFALGWLRQPRQHVLPLVLGGIVLFFLALVIVLATAFIQIVSKDFVVPMMALEDIGPFAAWRRVWPMIDREKGGYAGYIGMKIVMAIGAAIVIGIAATIVILIIAIPAIAVGVVAVIAGKTAGLVWTPATITLAVVAGCVLLAVILYISALVSVPAIVFFPAYSIYFFAARYAKLSAVLYPVPKPPPLPPDAAAVW